jgi:hypothetical protein
MFLTQYIFIKENYVTHVLKFHFSSMLSNNTHPPTHLPTPKNV